MPRGSTTSRTPSVRCSSSRAECRCGAQRAAGPPPPCAPATVPSPFWRAWGTVCRGLWGGVSALRARRGPSFDRSSPMPAPPPPPLPNNQPPRKRGPYVHTRIRVYMYACTCPCARVNAVSGPFLGFRPPSQILSLPVYNMPTVSTISRPRLLVGQSVYRLYPGKRVCAQCIRLHVYMYTRIRAYAHIYEEPRGDVSLSDLIPLGAP